MNDIAWLTFWMGVFGIVIIVGGARVIYNEYVAKRAHYKDMDRIERNIDLINFMQEVITAFVIPIILAFVTMDEMRRNGQILSIFVIYIVVSAFMLWQIIKAGKIENKLLKKMKITKDDCANEIMLKEECMPMKKKIKKIIAYNRSDKNEIFIEIKANFIPKELFIGKGKSLFNPAYLSKIGDKKFVLKVDKLIEDLGLGDNTESVRIELKNFEANKGECCKYVQLKKQKLSKDRSVWRVETE